MTPEADDYVPGTWLSSHLSARALLNPRSIAWLAALCLVPAVCFAVAPSLFFALLTPSIVIAYLASILDRNWLLIKGIRSSPMVVVDDAEARAMPDAGLPLYTVLLPVYDEPEILENLIDGVGRLEYPKAKLEILLLVEDDDVATQEAVRDITDNSVRVVTVPHSLPKTKPKACNYAMRTAGVRGEMMTIYDAEDVPEPLQLRKAVAAFRRLPADVGCLQCRLGYFNERQNLLTRWFSMEYDQWFRLILPAVQASNCVVLLGGTSSHLPTDVWRDVGGWDEFNVTEDADLGVRLARHGYRTLILDSETLEEANSDVLNWVRQRSRWYKGYLQTMFVHLRHPATLRQEIGFKATLRLINLTGAVTITNFLNLLFWLVMAMWVAGRPEFVSVLFPAFPYYVSLALLFLGAPISIYVGLLVINNLGKPCLWWAALLAPMYWLLQSVAAVKAVYQFIFRPSFWEKTVHGLSGQSRPAVEVGGP
nr:glycosyltransferase [Mycobacterium sp. IDR2000157661]